MKNYKHYIGIDVSKQTLDFYIVDFSAQFIINGQITNDEKGVKELFRQLKKYKIAKDKSLFCFENTGIYSMNLGINLSRYEVDFAHCSKAIQRYLPWKI